MSESSTNNGPIVIKNGPSLTGGLFLSIFAIGFSIFGVLGVLDALGIIEFGDQSVRFNALLGSFFILLGMLFAYMAIGALTCWEEVKIEKESICINKVTFLKNHETVVDNNSVRSITIREEYEHRTGETLELILEFEDKESIPIETHDSKENLIDLQNRIALLSGIPTKHDRNEIDPMPTR